MTLVPIGIRLRQMHGQMPWETISPQCRADPFSGGLLGGESLGPGLTKAFRAMMEDLSGPRKGALPSPRNETVLSKVQLVGARELRTGLVQIVEQLRACRMAGWVGNLGGEAVVGMLELDERAAGVGVSALVAAATLGHCMEGPSPLIRAPPSAGSGALGREAAGPVARCAWPG